MIGEKNNQIHVLADLGKEIQIFLLELWSLVQKIAWVKIGKIIDHYHY